MKKQLTGLLLATAVSATLNAECTIVTSPSPQPELLGGSDTLSLSIGNIYYAENKKGKKVMKFKTGGDALIEFDEKARKYIQEQCEKYKLKMIYNYNIRAFSDEHRYTFFATYDYK